MKNRKLAFFGACFVFLLSIAPFLQNQAEAAVISVELTPAQTLALYGDTIYGFYCANLNDYRSCSFSYVGVFNGLWSNQYGQYGNYTGGSSNTAVYSNFSSYSALNQYNYLVYYCPETPYNSNAANIDFQFELYPSVNLTSKKIISSFIFSQNSIISYNNYPAFFNAEINGGTVRYLCNTTGNPYTSSVYRTQYTGLTSLTSDISISGSNYWCCIPVVYESEEDFYFSSGNLVIYNTGSVNDSLYSGQGRYLLVQCPLLSDDFAPGADSEDDPVTPGTGIGQGTIDSDGNISITIPDYSNYLQDILDKLDEIAADQGYDDLVSDDLSSSADILDSGFDDYADAEEDLWSDIDGNLEALDSMDFTPDDLFENSDVLELAEGFSGFLSFGLLPIFIPAAMSCIVVSYIIFGKSR